MAELNGNQRASSGSDITLSCSDGSSGLNSPRESNEMFLDMKDVSLAANSEHRPRWGWPLASPRYTITDELVNNGETDGQQNPDLVHLSRKVEVTELELQTLRKQIAKESRRGQDLAKEVAALKLERNAFKEECEKLRASQRQRNKSNYEGNPWDLLEEVRQELNHEKTLNVNLQLQLQKTQDSNSELILAVQDLEQILEQNAISGNISEKLEGRKAIDDDDDDHEQKALEEIVKQHSDAKDSNMLEQEIMDLRSEIEMYRRDKDDLEIQMEQIALDYEILKQENHDMAYKLEQSHLRQQLKLQYECSGSYAAIYELENQVENLEKELNDRSNELSDSLAAIKNLEIYSRRLEDELEDLASANSEKEKQAIEAEEALRLEKQELQGKIETLEKELSKKAQRRGSGSDLEATILAKEQEQRAIRAEEALRLTRWKNANMASRLQDEFKRLSMEMQTTFEANEKVANKAMNEATQLRLVNSQLEQSLQQSREEIQSIKQDCEAQLADLQNQLDFKTTEIEEKTKQIDDQRENEDKVCQIMSDELVMLKSELDRIASDTAEFSACIEQGEAWKAELEQVKAMAKERNLLERHNLECLTESFKAEKELALRSLQSEMDSVLVQCEDLRRSLREDALEKEKLSKQVHQMKTELKKKDDSLVNLERKLKDSNGRAMAAERTKGLPKNSKAEIPYRGSKEAASVRVKIKLLEAQIKQKETAMETTTNSFLEKEKDLHDRIEELERRLQELNQNSMDLHNNNNVNKEEESSAFTTKEAESLKEKNASMETELKELRERYSEISLKFAEVEGERQQLVMTLRSIKNLKKS